MTDNARSSSNVLKFILLNLIGIFMFFVTISVGGKSSIPIDHIVTGLRSIPYFEVVYAGLIVVVGAILPFVRKTWNKDAVTTIFSIFKVIGIGVVGMAIFGWGPESFHTPDMLPFVFNKVVIPVTILVPVGAVFLSFLINYGLMEFIGDETNLEDAGTFCRRCGCLLRGKLLRGTADYKPCIQGRLLF